MNKEELQSLLELLQKFRKDETMKKYYRSEAHLLDLYVWELLNPEKVKEIDKQIEQEFSNSK